MMDLGVRWQLIEVRLWHQGVLWQFLDASILGARTPCSGWSSQVHGSVVLVGHVPIIIISWDDIHSKGPWLILVD